MTDFSIEADHTGGGTYPSSSTDPNALGLTNPDSILSGINRGTQMIGSPSLNIDSTTNLITVKPPSATGTRILRLGVIATGFLGLAINNGTVDTMFAGQDSSGNTVIKIAKAGFDAKTATSDQLIFNSSQNVFKIATSFTINNNFSITGTTFQSFLVTQPHGLSFTPAYMSYITLDSNLTLAGTAPSRFASSPAVVEGSIGGNISIFTYAVVTVDSTNIYFQIDVAHYAAVSVTNSVKVYLLQETFS